VWLFSDQYSLIFRNTVQNIVIAMCCMLVIALLLIPQPICALWVVVAIASIDVGEFPRGLVRLYTRQAWSAT